MSTTERVARAVVELYRESDGVPPTVREVAKRAGLASSGDVNVRLQDAAEQGMIRRVRHGQRFTYVPASGAFCPVCGHLAEPRRVTLTGS